VNDREGHERARERKRDVVAPCVLPGGMLLAVCLCADAAVPSLDITQFAHIPWKIGDGFTKGRVTSIVQTPDGYLWLVTEFGLARFDGGRPVPWRPRHSSAMGARCVKQLRETAIELPNGAIRSSVHTPVATL
jgi:ligand-binding sensor domain-containing protein